MIDDGKKIEVVSKENYVFKILTMNEAIQYIKENHAYLQFPEDIIVTIIKTGSPYTFAGPSGETLRLIAQFNR